MANVTDLLMNTKKDNPYFDRVKTGQSEFGEFQHKKNFFSVIKLIQFTLFYFNLKCTKTLSFQYAHKQSSFSTDDDLQIVESSYWKSNHPSLSHMLYEPPPVLALPAVAALPCGPFDTVWEFRLHTGGLAGALCACECVAHQLSSFPHRNHDQAGETFECSTVGKKHIIFKIVLCNV